MRHFHINKDDRTDDDQLINPPSHPPSKETNEPISSEDETKKKVKENHD
jgi:hypothetical protein